MGLIDAKKNPLPIGRPATRSEFKAYVRETRDLNPDACISFMHYEEYLRYEWENSDDT